MNKYLIVLSLAVFIGTFSTFFHEHLFLDRRLKLDGVPYRYQVFVPKDYSPTATWPIILFLHGAGERGRDGYRQTRLGLPDQIRKNADRFRTIVVIPQCRDSALWMGTMERLALAALDSVIREFHGDPDRVYLTGLSLGGQGTWYIAAEHPERFAAIAPVCGPVRILKRYPMPPDTPDSTAVIPGAVDPYSILAARLEHVPVWIFHGDSDDVVPVAESRLMAAALKKFGNDARYTEYPGIRHTSWDEAYGDPEFMQWLLRQKRGATTLTIANMK